MTSATPPTPPGQQANPIITASPTNTFSSSETTQISTQLPPLPASVSGKIDLLISVTLYTWPALTLATTSEFGGPTSLDKRDWFGGAISDLLASSSPFFASSSSAGTAGTLHDRDDLEDVLTQVMGDEFETVVEDGSLEEVARRIWEGRLKILSGDDGELERLWRGWWERQQKGGRKEMLNQMFRRGPDQEEDGEEEVDSDSDEEMDDAPQLVNAEQPRQNQKPQPEIDEEGFTKVVGKRGKKQ